MCAFHVKSPEIVTPKSLASLTNLMHSSPMTTGGKSQSDVKLMRSSLHLSVFNLTLFLIDQFTTSFTIPWASLCCQRITCNKKYAYIYHLNTKIRSTVLCLSGFELYSHCVPLALRTPAHNGLFRFSRRDVHVFSLKLTPLIQSGHRIYGQRSLFCDPRHQLSYNRKPLFTDTGYLRTVYFLCHNRVLI